MNTSFSQTLFTLELQSYQGTCDFSSNCRSFILESVIIALRSAQIAFRSTNILRKTEKICM